MPKPKPSSSGSPAAYQQTTVHPLDALTTYPGNARRGDVDAILASLRRNGQYRALVVRDHDGQLTILAGNHTAEALGRHGPGPCTYRPTIDGTERPCGVCGNREWEPSARCEIVVCDDDTARRINLVDNRAAELGDIDNDALAELLSYLEGDYDGTGYTDTDVERLLTPPTVEAPEEFPSYDDETITTEHQCPKCGYSWSGKSGPAGSNSVDS